MRPARTFVALPLTRQEQCKLFAIARSLVPTAASARLIKPENYHLTLSFLGTCSPRRLVAVRQQLSLIKIPTFSLRILSVEHFPGTRSPVISAIPGYSNDLAELHQQVTGRLLQAGFTSESRTFRPHITLGRSRSRLTKLPATVSMRVQAEQFELVKSEPSPTGSIYSPLAVFRLY